MEQTLIKPGGADEDRIVVFGIWVVLVAIVYVATDFGLWGTVTGTAGLYFVYRGVRALWQALVSNPVEEAAIGTLGGATDPVQIEGTARPADEPVTAPMTGTDSVAYRVEVIEYVPEAGE